MNYTVHAVMYFYYGLQAAGAKPKWGAIVTTMQIAQMFAGMAIVAATVVYQQQGLACDVMPSNTQGGALIYASYAALFLWFAWGRYCVRPKTAAGEAGKEE